MSVADDPFTPTNFTPLTWTADVFHDARIESKKKEPKQKNLASKNPEQKEQDKPVRSYLVLATAARAVELIYYYGVLHFPQANICERYVPRKARSPLQTNN